MTSIQGFRRDQLAASYSQAEWNKMYESAGKQADDLVTLWNLMYTAKSQAAVIFYNKMYLAVESGKKLSDPDLQAEIVAWNKSQALGIAAA